MSSDRPVAPGRAEYRAFRPLATRWADNDVYGHVNNVVYYSFFDTAVNGYLVDAGALTVGVSPVIGLVVDSQCSYFASLAFPDRVEAGLRIDRLGRSSIAYGIGIFAEGADRAAASGRFVHVTVDRETRRPVPVPETMRTALAPLLAGSQEL
ncbi:MAG: thioesterase family protein [Pseudomonadota bacterium]